MHTQRFTLQDFPRSTLERSPLGRVVLEQIDNPNKEGLKNSLRAKRTLRASPSVGEQPNESKTAGLVSGTCGSEC